MRYIILITVLLTNISCNKKEISLTIVNNSDTKIDSIYNINSTGINKFYEKINPNDSLVLWFKYKRKKRSRYLNSVIFFANGKSYESGWGNITGYTNEMRNRIILTDEYLESLKCGYKEYDP